MNNRALYIVCLAALAASAGKSQTTCGLSHPEPGIVICSPEAGANAPLTLPDIFHVSAFGKAPSGQKISSYRIFIDQELVEESRLTIASDQLAIESNIKYPNRPGLHTLIVTMAGVGSAEVKKIRFTPATSSVFCDQVTFVRTKSCYPASTGRTLQWALTDAGSSGTSESEIDRLNSEYVRHLTLYRHNLKEIEADTADAIALDAKGNLYVVRHSFADLELRKYAFNGSVTYSGLLRACGDGMVTVVAAASGKDGRVWIAGNTSACLAPTDSSKSNRGSEKSSGFIALFDTTKANVTAPQVVRYVADEPVRITAIQTDKQGNVYVAGQTGNDRLTGAKNVSVPGTPTGLNKMNGFVIALDPDGAAVKWSTCLRQIPIQSIAVDEQGNVFLAGVTGQKQSPFLVQLSDNGSQLTYAANVQVSGIEHLSLALTPQGHRLTIAGENHAARKAAQLEPFFVSVNPCSGAASIATQVTGKIVYAAGTAPVFSPALDATMKVWKSSLDLNRYGKPSGKEIPVQTLISPKCNEGL